MKCLQLLLAAVVPVTAAALSWKNVKIGGGGGFVPGIVFHPTVKGVAYARTDIGGLYRLNSDDSWTAVTDSLATNDRWNSWGIDAVALDPQDANKVYAAVGMYTTSWDPNNGAIIRSSDQGATWSTTELPFKVGGNMPGRGMGERLAVDPHNSNIIYFGARSGNGLWKSTDGGVSFSKVSSFTNTGSYIVDPTDPNGYNSDKMGLAFVTFDSTSPLSGGATSRIFVGTADNITASVYVSNDAGVSWTAVPNQPAKYFPHKCRLQPAEKALYFTYSDGTGPYDGTLGGVYRYDLTTGTWKDITPVSGGDLHYGFGGLGLDMQKPGTLVVASLNSWWPDAQLFRSTDSGTTWSPIWEWAGYPDMNLYYGITSEKAPWINTGFISQDSKRLGWMIEALEINPLDSNHWLYGTGLTIYGGHDLTNWDKPIRNVSISSLADGIEEMAVLGLASAPGGPELLAAVGDDNGFTFATAHSLNTSPHSPWMNPLWATSVDVDYAGLNPSSLVRIGNSPGTPQLALSTNSGTSWTAHLAAGTTSHSGSVALSADASTILWATENSGVLRSQGPTNPFVPISSLPSATSKITTITSDKLNTTIFYAASSTSGTLYRSLDSGLTFSPLTLATNISSIRDVVAHPTISGTLLISTNLGIYLSTNHGSSATLLPTLSDTQRVSFGVGSGERWNIYAFGVGSTGAARLYGTSDGGKSWVDIQGDKQGFGAISSCRVVGSGNVKGQVYVGTNGRGVLVGLFEGGGGGGTSSTKSSSVGTATSTLVTSASASGKSTSSTTSSSVKSTISTTSTTTSATPTNTAVAERWGQCGGIGWSGPTACRSPWGCKVQNDYYSQCL